MQLRQYQLDAKKNIYSAWNSGILNAGIVLPTGAGKTILFTDILEECPDESAVIAHRMEIVSQISITLAKRGLHHNIIAQKNTLRNIVSLHMQELKRSYYHQHSRITVAGVDTLIKLQGHKSWMDKVKLVIQDEAHHVLQHNKWGKAAAMFPNARGLYPTATPIRADGYGLGRHADGVLDTLIVGPSMRDLIKLGYLTDYRIFAPPSDLDLSEVTISASGDYSPPKLRTAVHKSHITGDVVSHYLRIASGKLGVTFAVDIESATQIAAEFRAAGVSAEVISSKTPDLLRAQIMRRFREREILQIVNVDLLGEGFDVPAIEVISMARPTQSYCVYAQQFGRALRPMKNKSHAIIIDHVGNVVRHGLPDRPRQWSLDRRERRSRSTAEDVIPVKTCLNPECLSVYERTNKKCPYCGYYSPPASRSTPEFCDGDLLELDETVLAKLRGEINRIDAAARVPQHLDSIAQRAVMNRHLERQEVQTELRKSIAQWAGYLKSDGVEDSEIYRRFYFKFGVDIATAQTLGINEATSLTDKINRSNIQ